MSTRRHCQCFIPVGTYSANAVTTWLQGKILGGEILIQIPLEAPEPPGLLPDGWARELTRYVHVVREQVGAVYSVDNDLRRRVDRICDKSEEYLVIYEARRSRRRQDRH